MKIKRSVLLFVVICVALMLLVIRFRRPIESASPPETETNSVQSPVAVDNHKVSSQQTNSPVQTNAAIASGTTTNLTPLETLVRTKAEQMKEGLAALNDEEVVFYGRVVDQFDAPVANATVAGSVQVNNGTRVGVDRFSLTTDANGMFTINGYKGKTLGIWVTKDGYVMATTATSFVYSHLWPEDQRHNPDPNNPAVIKMWKLQGAERLTGIEQRYKFRYSDAPVFFDLLAGKIVPAGGDMKITMSRSPGEVSERTLQDWSVRVEAVDGGLIKTSVSQARVTYQLPEAGYMASDFFVMSTNPPHKWHGGADQMYYVKSRDGQVFSKLNFGVSINQQPDDYVWVELHGELNPNGSRNFEADANAMVSKP